jgi:hypothetical protein
VAGVAALGLLGLLWTGTLRLKSSRIAWVGVALLVGFACWSGVSLLWSVAPDQTWIEVNRVIAYTIVLCLGLAIGSSYTGALALIARGFLVVVVIVTAYALGQKLFPGLHISGVFTLNQTGALTRLQEPLGYWNALALFMSMGAPVALAMTVDRTRSARARLLTAGALQLMVVTVPFTYSRGGILALAIALLAGVALGGERLRSAVWLVLVVLSALPAILAGLLLHQLNSANVPLGTREWAGAILALVLAASLLALGFAGRWLIARESRIQITRASMPAAPDRPCSGRVGGCGRTGWAGRVSPGDRREHLALLARLYQHQCEQHERPEPAPFGSLTRSLGVVEGGGGGFQRTAVGRMGRGLISGHPPPVPPQHPARPATS